jgi:DNA (cytosine-5)-methyltransferase 1
MPSNPLYSVAELFCGCGGFSRGFSRTGRFRAVLGNDVKKQALETFRRNHAEHGEPAVIAGDIRNVPDANIIAMLEEKGVSELDCLIGGPPCQGFSQMRRGAGREGSKIVRFGGYDKLDQDPRNDLVLRFLEIAAALNPKVIVIENVPQFLSHYHDGQKGGIARQVEEILGELGYETALGVINSADYGVPQLRQRAIVIASRIGRIALPQPTHGDVSEQRIAKLAAWVTVRDALADLPADPPMRDERGVSVQGYASPARNDYAKWMRTSKTFAANHITRAYQQRIINVIRQMTPGETWDDASARMCKRYDRLVEKAVAAGEVERAARRRLTAEGRIIHTFYKRYYWSAYTRLSWDEPALTITANANFLGSGRFTHPERDRGITMREAARLQSFDDAFTFHTAKDPRRAEKIGIGLDMIGEAVPPLVGKVIGDAVAQQIDAAAQAGIPRSAEERESRPAA